MERKKINNISDWLVSERRKPLIIRGARQVGKSTLVGLFAKKAGRRLFTVNLERHVGMDRIFASLDPEKILAALEALPGSRRLEESDILFLDEIQATPHALAALRYFYEERPGLPIIAAGSLLEFALADHKFSMPVGRVSFMRLDPMDFEEFLAALHEDVLLERLRSISPAAPGDSTTHARLMELFRIYSFVGGMPEAVATWVETRSPRQVRSVQSDLIDAYKADFAKYAVRQDLAELHILFERAALHVGRKVKYVNLLPDQQSRTVRRLLDLLVGARLYQKVHHADCQGLPLRAGRSDRIYKLLMLDVGLFNAVRRTEWTATTDELTSVAHQGAVAEQVVGQELLANHMNESGDDLVYWLREGRSGNAEVDYVVAAAGRIVPVEVKSGEGGTLKSLFAFAAAHASELVIRCDLKLPVNQRISHAKSGVAEETRVRLLSVPLYAIGQVQRLVKEAL